MTPTITDMLTHLREAQVRLGAVAHDTDEFDDLSILIDRIKRGIKFAAFDPLTPIDSADMKELTEAVQGLKDAIQHDKERMAFLGKILKIGKGIAKTAGLPIP